MAISREERIARKIQHTKQERLQISNGVPSVNELRTGVPVVRATTEGLVEYTRYNNALYKKVLDRADVSRVPAPVTDTSIDVVPVFQVYRSGSAQANLAITGERILEFNSVEIDTRGGYSTTSFLYTVSEKGIYSLHYNLTFQTFDVDMTYAGTYIKDSGANRFAMHRIDEEEFVANSGIVSFSTMLVRQLDVGETLGVYFYQSGGASQVDLGHLINSTNGSESVFGGYMITDVKSRRAAGSAAAEGSGGNGHAAS
tara:strand:- start:39 stop:806 length:768 start_codon:yes stop_codon:yes gene_type:complete